jgi:hypothetical protein
MLAGISFLRLVAGEERQEDLADGVAFEADRDGQPGRAVGQGFHGEVHGRADAS